jgi:hypothetical protein
MSIFLSIGIILFFIIFAVAAALTLLSLIGKVKMEKSYQNKLFTVLIIEVIGTIIAFVSYNLKPDFTPNISEKILLSNNGYWEWSYPEAGWRTRIYFLKDTAKSDIFFEATTFYIPKDSNNKLLSEKRIYQWESSKPISIPQLGKEIEFEVTKKTLDDIVLAEPDRKKEIGQVEKGIVRLSTDISLKGTYVPQNSTQNWGIILNYGK